MKYFIISQPKAGTYLAGNLLKNMGIVPSNMHFDPGSIRKFYDLNNVIKIDESFDNAISNILLDNEYAVGHIPYTLENEESLRGIKKVLITRSEKEIRESAKRYLEEHGINVEEIIKKSNLEKINNWNDKEEVFSIRFEDVVGKNVEKINQLQMFLFNDIKYSSFEIVEKSLTEGSLTKSSIR